MRTLLLVAVLACCSTVALAEDKEAPSKLAEAKAAFDKKMQDKMAEIRKARTQEEARDLQSEFREMRAIEMDNLFDAAAKEPESQVAFDVFADLLFGGFDEAKSKLARTLIEKHHLEKAHVKKVLLPLAYRDQRADFLLKTVAEKNEDKECKAHATLGLGMFFKNRARTNSGEAREEDLNRAKDYYKLVVKDFGDVKYGNKTLAKMAEGDLAAMALIGQLEIGKAVPEISGVDLDDKAMKLSDHKGKVVMISFWATWCPPCMAMVPHEREVVEANKDKPFVLVGINGDPDLNDTVRETIADKKITWRSFKDTQGEETALSQLWEIEGWPTIYLIDHKGIIKQKWTGSPGNKKLDEAIEELVKAAEADKK